jgi:hypothetical protein
MHVLRQRKPSELAAAILCVVNPVVDLFIVTWNNDLPGVFFQFVALALISPVMASLQIAATALIINEGRSPWTIWPILLLSACAAADYARFAVTLDLASSSTAAVGLVLYPVTEQAIWAVPAALLTFWIGRRVEGRRKE